MIIGSHVSVTAPEYLAGSVREALGYGANALMVYTGAPQNTKRKPVMDLKPKEARELMKEAGISMEHMIIHAPYIINPANASKETVRELARSFLIQESARVEAIGASYLVLHPGSYTDMDLSTGIATAIDQLNSIDDQLSGRVTICLETMAGKGSEIGFQLEQLEEILEGLHSPQKYGICLDTCHMNDAGYDVSDFDSLLDEFDRILGLSRLKVIHLNDSKNPRGARKDRHENIGLGAIGFETLYRIAHNERTAHIPKILETPYIGKKAPYGVEIEMLKNGVFDRSRLEALKDESK
jgi:deoxyribonuclease-4